MNNFIIFDENNYKTLMKNLSLNVDEAEINSISKVIKSQEISHKAKILKENFNNVKEPDKLIENNFITKLSAKINSNSIKNIKNQKYQIRANNFKSLNQNSNRASDKRINSALTDCSQSRKFMKSGNLTFRKHNLKLLNSPGISKNNNQINRKQSYNIFSSNLRPFSSIRLKSRNISSINKLNNFKTFNKKHIKIYENESDESSDEYNENQKNSYFIRKKLIINGRETSDYERFWYDAINAKLLKEKENRKKKRQNIKIKYNEKVFNRNNQIIVPNDLLKRQLTSSSEKNNTKKLKNLLNSLNTSKMTINNYNNSLYKSHNQFKKKSNEKILKKIIEFNDDLNAFKYFAINDLVGEEKDLHKKINDIENKLLNEHEKLIIKNIIYEKLDKTQKENLDDSANNEKSLNVLISNADKAKTKKFQGFVEKRFNEELKKLEKFNNQDNLLNNMVNEQNTYYISKQNNNKIQEEKIKKDRKNLLKNTKKIRKLAEVIYNKKMNIGNIYKYN